MGSIRHNTPPAIGTGVRQAVFKEWSSRVGVAAATYRARVYTWLRRAWAAGTAGIILLGVGGRTHTMLLTWVGVACVGIWIGCSIKSWIEQARMRNSISQALGIPIRWRSNPPPPN